MKRPKTMSSKTRVWFSLASIFLLVIAFAVSAASNSMAATGSFDRGGYLPDLGTNDYDRSWITVTDSASNTTSERDTVTVTINVRGTSNFTTFKLQETGTGTGVFTTTGGTQPVMYPVGTSSGYVEDFNSGSHNYPALGTSVNGLNLKEFTANIGGDATTGTPGSLAVETGNTLDLLFAGSTLDSAPIQFNSGTYSFIPSAVSAATTDSSVSPNLIVSVTDPDENLNPVARDVIGFADGSALLATNPGTGSSRVQVEAIDQTTGTTLNLGGTNIIASNIMLVETGPNTGVFSATGKVFGTSTTVSASDLKGNVTVGTSAYSGAVITLGTSTPLVEFRIIETNASGGIGLYFAIDNTPVLGFVSPASNSFPGSSTLGLSKVVASGTNTSLFGSVVAGTTTSSSASGLIKLIDGSNYCLVAIGTFTTGNGSASTTAIGSTTVELGSFQLAGPRSGDTIKVSYLDELRDAGTSGTVTGTLAYGVTGVTGTLAGDGTTAPDINDFVTITVVDANLNTSTSTQESVAAGSPLFTGTTTNNRGDRLKVAGYNLTGKQISVSHPDGFKVGTQSVRISSTDNSFVWVVPDTLTTGFGDPLTSGSSSFSLGTESVSNVPLVRGDSAAADSFLSSATTSSFVATLDGLDNTVEISPDGTRWISVPIVETGANSATFVGTISFDDTRVRLTTNTSTSITALITDFTGTSSLTFQNPNPPNLTNVIGTGSVVRIFNEDGSAQEFAEVCSVGNNTLSVTKLSNSTVFDPDKTWVQVIGNDLMPERLDTTSTGIRHFRIGGYCGANYRLRYNDALGDGNVYMGGDTLAVTASDMGFTTHDGSISTDVTGTVAPNSTVVVTVVDNDLNISTASKQSTNQQNDATSNNIFNEDGLGVPSGSSTANASFKNGGTSKIVYASTLSSIRNSQVSLDAGGNTIDFKLIETANDSGTFKGSFTLSSGSATSNSNDVLKVSNGDVVRAFYIDSPTGNCESSDLVTEPLNVVTGVGVLTLNRDLTRLAFPEGDTVVATVVDIDRNANSSGIDTLTTALRVTGVNYNVGTDLTLDLVENGADTGTFLASFKTGTTTDAGTTPQTLKTVQGGVANVIYTDTSPQATSAVAPVGFSAGDATLDFDADTYALDTFALITLSDPEQNTVVTSVQTLLNSVFIRTSIENSTNVRMVENGTDTGVFVGSIKVASSGGTTEFSQIQAAQGDTLTISYIDVANTTGLARTVTDTSTVTEQLTGNIAGQVTDSVTGDGINGATVTLDTGETATTGSVRGINGVYVIRNVLVGQHDITVSATNYADSTQTITVEEGEPDLQTEKNVFNVALTSTIEFGSISGQVTDSATTLGISGATVAFGTSPQNVVATTTTDADGNYSFANVVPGAYAVAVQATGYEQEQPVPVRVDAGEAEVVNFALTAMPITPTPTPTPTPTVGNIGGQVTDGTTGLGIVGATVTIETGESATTIANGVYAIRDVAAGVHTVTASAAGYSSDAKTIELAGGENERVDFALIPGSPTPTPTPTPTPAPCTPTKMTADPTKANVAVGGSATETITVTNEDGIPCEGVQVTSEIKKGKKKISVTPVSQTTNADGQAVFEIDGVKKGDAEVKFTSGDLKVKVKVKVK